jgi:hypothetical protein
MKLGNLDTAMTKKFYRYLATKVMLLRFSDSVDNVNMVKTSPIGIIRKVYRAGLLQCMGK